MNGSSEFELMVKCCALSFRGSRPDDLLTNNVNWSRFLELVRFHRVEGLAWNALSSNERIPGGIHAAMSEAASTIAAQNLRAAAECRNLLRTFDDANAPLLILKGLSMGALAYGNPTLKSAIDIDLLIDPVDIGKAATLLREAGYELVAPRPSRDDVALSTWHRGWKESVWAKADPRLQVDLHTRTADNRRLIPQINVHSPRQSVRIADQVDLPTLADEELFAYLAVHGASSAWFRLKWISDFAGLLQGRGSVEIERLHDRSQYLRAGRAAGQALLLADRLFGTLRENPELRETLERDPATVSLYRAALKLLTGEPIEPTAQRWGTWPIHRTQFLLLSGLGFKLSELSRQAARTLTRV